MVLCSELQLRSVSEVLSVHICKFNNHLPWLELNIKKNEKSMIPSSVTQPTELPISLSANLL